MSDQTYSYGDVVLVKKHPPGSNRSHFKSGYGVINYSYRDKYGGGKINATEYGIDFGDGTSAWYPEKDLTLIRKSNLVSFKEYVKKVLKEFK